MSVLSNIFKSVVSPLAKNIPVVGDIVGGFIDSQVSEYESNKQWAMQTGWQKYMADMQNQFNANQNDFSRQFAKSQQDDAQQFNAEQAQLARDSSQNFEREMFNAENAYNSPSNQIKMLRDAGINPNLFGSAFNSAIASSTPSSSPSASSSPISVNALGSGSIPNPPVFNNPSLLSSQIKLNEAQTDKLKADEQKTITETDELKSLLHGKLELQDLDIQLGKSNLHVNDAKAKELLASAYKLNSDAAFAQQGLIKMKEEILSLQQQRTLTQKEIDSYDSRLQSALRKELSETAKNYSSIRVDDAMINQIASQIFMNKLTSGNLALDFEYKSKTLASNIELTLSEDAQKKSDIKFDTKIFDEDKDAWQNVVGLGRWITRSLGRVLNGNVGVTKRLK